MSVFSNTEMDAAIPEIWDLKVEEARYAASKMLPRVTAKSDVVKSYGDKINVTIDQKLSVVDVTAGTGAFSVTSYTPSTVQLVVNKWKAVPIEVVDITDAQAFWTPASTFPTMAAKGLAEQYDTDLLSLYSNIDAANTIGTEGAPKVFDENTFLAAFVKYKKLNLPTDNLTFVVPVEGLYEGLFKVQSMVAANSSGKGSNMLVTGKYYDVLGVPCFDSTLIAESNGVYKAMLFHKSAFAIAMQINNKYEKARGTAAGKLSDILVMHSLYGVKTIRTDHAVVMNIAKA